MVGRVACWVVWIAGCLVQLDTRAPKRVIVQTLPKLRFARALQLTADALDPMGPFSLVNALPVVPPRASAEISDAVRSRRRRGGEEGSSKGVGVLAMLITTEVMRFACKPRLEAEIFEPVHDDLRSPGKRREHYSSGRYSVEPA